jgi:hypothetical protein
MGDTRIRCDPLPSPRPWDDAFALRFHKVFAEIQCNALGDHLL